MFYTYQRHSGWESRARQPAAALLDVGALEEQGCVGGRSQGLSPSCGQRRRSRCSRTWAPQLRQHDSADESDHGQRQENGQASAQPALASSVTVVIVAIVTVTVGRAEEIAGRSELRFKVSDRLVTRREWPSPAGRSHRHISSCGDRRLAGGDSANEAHPQHLARHHPPSPAKRASPRKRTRTLQR